MRGTRAPRSTCCSGSTTLRTRSGRPSPRVRTRWSKWWSLGAGLDPLALLLHADFPDVPFLEIDHPETQAVKTHALRRHKALPENVTFLPVDFAVESVQERLRGVETFRPQARSLFLAEGLLMYLSEQEVSALFDLVRRHSAPGSQFLFTFLDSAALADPESAVGRMAQDLERMGEPFQWSLHRKKLDGFLRHHGFRRHALVDHRTLKGRYPQSTDLEHPPVQGEVVVMAEVL